MEMKNTVGGIAPIVLIMYLAVRDFFLFFFSSKLSAMDISDHHDDQSRSGSIYHQILVYAKPSYLFIFFTFNILVVAALLGISSQLSKSSSTILSNVELCISSFMDSYEGLKREKEDDGFTFIPGIAYGNHEEEGDGSYMSNILFHFCFKNAAAAAAAEIFSTTAAEEVFHGNQPYGFVDEEYKEFVPGMVHVQYKEEKVEGQRQIDDDHMDMNMMMTEKNDEKDIAVVAEEKDLVLDEYSYDYYSELDDVDFNKRIEEFIDENNKKWREDLQNEIILKLYS